LNTILILIYYNNVKSTLSTGNPFYIKCRRNEDISKTSSVKLDTMYIVQESLIVAIREENDPNR